MELSALKFAADTTELERASKVIAGLVTDVAKLDKASRDAAQTEAILAKAAKSNADANLQNAKAQDVRLKSTIAADKADKSNEQTVVKKTKAIEKETEATAKNVGVLQKQKDILEFQTQGYSKGQAGILAYGKAAGLAASDIAELGKVLETQRKLMGGDPFDKSLSGIKSLQNQYTELKESLRQYNTDSELSAKQTRELARDKERLIEKMKVEGASFQDIRKAVRAHNDEYVSLAGQYNKLSSAEDAVVKSRKEMVQATNYLTTADQKMSAALSTTNAALDKAGTDSLVKYEQALRKSGVSQDVATAKLAKYKVELAQVQNQEQKRREQHLARAISPQITDIGVSLYSGQAPLTVLLQQSGQLVDLFTLSGVEASKFGETMKQSFYSMVPAIGTVAKGMAGLVSGLVVDAGKGITNFIGGITGISLAMETAKRALASGGEENFKYIASLQKLSNIAAATSAILAGGLVLALIAMAVGLKQVISENNELAKSLALNNGNLAITQSSAVEYVRLLGEMGVTTGKATEAIAAMAKEGKFTRDEILLVGKAASDMAKYADVAIEDTVKSFAKLKDKPVEGLIELAQKTGMVSPEVIKLVIELERQGKIAEATAVSMKTLGSVTETQVAQMKENYNGFTLFILELGSKIKQFFSDTFKVLFLATDPTQQLQDNLGKVQERIKEVRENLEGNSKVLNFLGIGTDTKLLDSLKEQERQILKNIDRQVSANQVKEQEIALNVQNAKVQGVERELSNKADKALDKQRDKLLNMEDYRKKFVQDKLADYAKEKNIDIEVLRGNEKILSVLKEQADVEFKKIHKKESNAAARQGIKDLETEIDILNKRAGLSSSYNNELASLQRLREKNIITEDEYIHDVEELIELQPFYIAQQKEINDAHELSNSLLGKQDMLGKDYYKRLEQIDKYQKMGVENGGYSVEQADKLRQAAFDQTELAKTRLKIEQDSAKLVEKYRDDIEKSQNASALETANLDDRLALLGLTSEQQKNLRIEQERRNKLLAIDLKLQTQIQEVWDKWGNGEFGVDGATKAKAVIKELTEQAGVDAQNVNKETAVKFREDFDAEFRKIEEGVTDSIVTALFEGGKAGSKKLRDVLVNVLRQKVTMVVDVGVNAFMNSMMGGFFGGGGTGAAGGGGGLSSMIGMGQQAYSLYNGYNALSSGQGVMGSIGSWLGLGSGTGAGPGATAVNGLSALTPVKIGTNTSMVTGVTAGGGSGGAAGSMAGAGAFAAVAALALNALGAFKSERKVAGGLSGTLGKGNINAWEEWREGGTLFSGPEYSTFDPTAELDKAREKLAKARESGDLRNVALQEMLVNNLEDTYGGLAEATMKQSKVIQSAFDTMRNSAASMADVLGVSSEKAKNFTTLLGGEKGLNFEGLSAQEQQGKLDEALATANNELAQQILGTWEATSKEVSKTIITGFGQGEESGIAQSWETLTETIKGTRYVASEYAKEGEKAIDTLTRLATSLATVKDLWADMRVDFDATGLAGADAASKIADAFGGLEAMTQQFSSYIGNYYSEAEKKENLARRASEAFSKVGLSFSSDDILKATKPTIRGFVEGVLSEFGPSSPQYVAAIQQANLLAGLYTDVADAVNGLSEVMRGLKEDTANLEIELLRAKGNTAGADSAQRLLDTNGFTDAEIAVYDYNQSLRYQITAINEASNAISKLSSDVAGLFAARNSAGSLLDKIAGAMGNQGSFASQREGELWSALAGTSDYKKQVELSSQLTDIVLERQRIEVQNAEKLLNFGRGLRDYVNGLKLSDLSPLTNAEKLAEASKQYSETLSKAISGDANAQAGLQSISSSYLELARTYYAGNEQFVDIFNSVTSSLDTLGINSMTESQQQLAIGNQSLSELQKLYGITETAYQALNTQYESSLSQLEAQKNALILQADSLTQLRSIAEILYGLPAEISARIGGGRSYFQDNPDVAAAYLQNNYGLSEKDYSFEHYLKYGKDEGRELPSFAKGIDYVPYDMTANIHQGERVLTKLENRNYSKLTSASDNSELVNAIKSLQVQVEKLEASNREDARMQASTYVGASQAAASTIAAATTKAARTTELKQGATIK